MLGKTSDTESAKSVISSDMKIKGKISADGDLVLLGSVVGDIKCHSLSVEDTGTLKGNIDADVVTVSGKCDGQVSGDIVSIKSTGKITGEVFYENISIEISALSDGAEVAPGGTSNQYSSFNAFESSICNTNYEIRL